MKKLLIVDRYFFPDLQATSVLLTDLAEELSKNFDITILCGPASLFRDRSEKSISQILIKVLPAFQFNHPNFLKRFLNYSSFLFAVFTALFFVKKPDIILVQSSPPLLPFVTAVVSRIRKIPYVYVCQDLFPGTAVKSGELCENWFTRFAEWAHLYASKHAKKVVTIGRDMRELLLEKKIPSEHVALISNWASDDGIKPLPKLNEFSAKHRFGNDFIVMHAGNFGLVQDFDFLLKIAKELDGCSQIRFVFVGDGASKERVMRMACAMNLSHAQFISFVSKENISEVLSSADLQIVSLKKGLAGYSVPSKTYSLLASGSAILGLIEKQSEPAVLINEAGCGIVSESENALEAAETIKKLSENSEQIKIWKKNARDFFDKKQFRENSFKEYKSILLN